MPPPPFACTFASASWTFGARYPRSTPLNRNGLVARFDKAHESLRQAIASRLAHTLALVGSPSSWTHVACGHPVRLCAHKAS